MPQNGNYSAPRNIKVRSVSAAWAASPGVSIGGVGGRPSGGVWKYTGGEVTIHVRAHYRVVRPKGTTIRSLHGVYFYLANTLCLKLL